MDNKQAFDPKLVEKVEGKDISLFRYLGAIPNILLFQFNIKLLLSIVVGILTYVIDELVNESGIVAITNTDLPYLFRSWQGICVLIIGFLILCLYAVFDINAMILISDNILHNKGQSIFDIIKKSLTSVKLMLHPKALLVIIFVVLIAPLTVSLYGVSLTESFYIPDFILSVIHKNPMMNIPYYAFLTVMAFLGFIYIFTFQFMILRQVNISEAMHTSRLTMKKYWKDFLKRYSLFLFKYILLVLLLIIVFFFGPLLFIDVFLKEGTSRFLIVFVSGQFYIIIEALKMLFTPYQIMELNRIYESYTEEDEGSLVLPKKSLHIRFWVFVLFIYGLLTCFSFLVTSEEEAFDYIFPLNTPSEIVAHRAGGTLGNENTIVGLEAAIKKQVYGSEIDIQRTKDGHYIVYHDDRLDRLCGVDKKPSELTLEECKQLRVIDTFDLGGKSAPLATLEEFLDTVKGSGVTLYVEMKGETADLQMVEDLYEAIVQRDMLDEVVTISLKYELIAAMEEKHPEVTTGFLCFVSLGDVTHLACDLLLLEDEMATYDVIQEAHQSNKKVFIWTVNTEDTMKQRMLDESDGIITDEVNAALRMHRQLSKRGDLDRILDVLTF